MASGLYTISACLSRNVTQRLKHSTSLLNSTSKWRTIATLSVNSHFVDEAFTEEKKNDDSNVLDFRSLKEKEKGDWRNLTLQEKQALYHLSFSQPYCTVEQPGDEWKLILGGTFTAMGIMTLFLMWISQIKPTENVIGPLSPKFKEEKRPLDDEVLKSA